MTTTSFLPSSEKLYNNDLYAANDITANKTDSFNDSSTSNQLQVLSLWINFKLERQEVNSTTDGSIIKSEYIVELVNKLCPGSIKLNDKKNKNSYIENNNTTQQNDHLSYVAQILNILLEQNDGHIVHSTLVNQLDHAIIDNHMEIIFKFISWIALKLYLNNILLDDNIKSYAFQLNDDFNQIAIQPTIPKFQLYDLSFQHIFLDIRKYLLIWVNWQFKICTSDISSNFVPIFDFGDSWKNGLAFALLIYCSNKSLLSDDLLIWIQQTIHNKQIDEWWTFKDDNKASATILSNVFNIAKIHMDIPNYLQPQGLLDVSYLNEWCIILYVYEFYQHHMKHSTKITNSELDLQKTLDAIEKASYTVNSNNNNITIPLHPLDHPNDDSINLYIQKVYEAQSLWEKLKSQNMNMDTTSINIAKNKYELFILGIDYVKISDAIQYELQLINGIMNNSDNKINNDIVQQLTTKIDVVKSSIYGLKEAFNTLLTMERYDDHFQQVKNQYELVNGWVDQVIEWKTESENIKNNINEWIDLIKQRNSMTDKFDINALEIIDISIFNDLNIMEIHTEHEQLKKNIKDYENNKMKHFYDLVQKQTNTQQQHYSTPADTITISIASATLNEFDNLFQHVNERSFWIDCLVDRLKWEHIFDKSVKWIALMDSHLDYFFRHQALWCQQDNDFDIIDNNEDKEHLILSTYVNKENVEKIITTLVEMEQSISNFDRGSFTEVLNAYQEMETHAIDNKNNNNHLPQILEQRQNGFESAFDDLMKRCTLSRKVVEQKLVMMDVATQFKNIKSTGETLRRRLLVANDGLDDIIIGPNFSDSSNHHSDSKNTDNKMDDENNNHENENSSNSIEDSVQSFKESSADFITHIKSRIPFPEIPIMATAMGSTDAQDVTTTNDAIKSTIHTCGMTLALLADGLEQLLMERQHIHSLQRRTKHACEQLSRFTDWMYDKKQLLIKTDFDVYKYIGSDEQDGDFTTHAVEDKNEEVLSLEKERDNIASRLGQIEQEDLEKLIENVNHLESDIDEANAVSVDRHSLVNAFEKLEYTKLELNDMLIERSNKLESLKKYLTWKSHWIKTNQWTLTTTRKLWDFCMKRARFDLQVEDTNKPSNEHEREMAATLNSYQERVNDTSEKQIKNLSDLYTTMVDEMNKWELGSNGDSDGQLFKDQIVIDFTSKQSILIQKYRSLVLLLQYASKLIIQRSSVIFTLQQFHESNREGERIRDNIIKATRRITDFDPEYVNNQNQPYQQPNLHQRAEQFGTNINELWNKHVEIIIYPMYSPKCNDQSFCSIFSSTQIQQKQQADLKNFLKNKMDQLKKLDSTFSELLEAYDRISKRKELVMEYSMNALELDQWIQNQIINLKKRHIDVSLETIDILNERSWDDLDQQHKKFITMMNSFEKEKLQPLHSKITSLVDEELKMNQQKQNSFQNNQNKQRKSIDVTIPASQHLGNVINSFSTLKHEVKDETIYLGAFAKRIKWTEALQDALSKLEIMQDRLIEWSKHKDEWVELEIDSYNENDNPEIEEEMLKNLVDELEGIIIDKDNFITTILPTVYELYDTFIDCFSNLPRPMATPDHIEVTMNSLIRSKNRFQESLNSKTKELDILQECRRWDSKWKVLCDDTNKNNKAVELFTTNRARWSNKTSNDDDEFFNQLIKDTKELQHRCFIQCRVDELKDQLERVTEDILMNNMNDNISKRLSIKFTRLDVLSCFASKLSSFLNMVIDQNGLVRGLCLQLNQLENELITALDMYNANRAEENSKCNSSSIIDQYRQFNKNIGQLQINVDKMIYPVRPTADNDASYKNEDGNIDSNNSDVNIDSIANNLIKDTLNNGIARLNHSLSEFGSLLAHEKKVLQDESYQEYSEKLSLVKEWIDTQLTKINDVKTMLEDVATQLLIDENNKVTAKDIPTEKYFSILNGTSNSVCDIQHLLQSNQHLISELTVSKCKWMDLLDENINLIEHSFSSDSQITQNAYKETLSDWDDLQKITENLDDQVQNRYLPALLDCGLLQLNKNIKMLEFAMSSQHYSLISDDNLNEWSEQLNYTQKEYNFIRNQFDINTESATESINIIEKDIHQVNVMYRNIDKNSKDWNKTQKQQLEAEQFIRKVADIVQDSISLCEDVSKANLSDGEENIKISQIQWTNQHKNIKENMQQLEINYHEILSSLLISSSKNSSSYTLDEFILNHQQKLKSQIDKSWLELHHHTASIVRNINILNKWIKLYTELKDARQVLLGCKTTLETMLLQKSNIIYSKDDLQSNQSAIVENIDRQLKTTLPWIKNLTENIDSNLTNDHYHCQSFMDYYQKSIELGNHVKTLLDDYYKTKVYRSLYNQYQNIIDQRVKSFIKQQSALKKYNKHYQDIYYNYKQLNDQQSRINSTNGMRKILNSHITDIEHAQDVIVECNEDLDDSGEIGNLCNLLTNNHNQHHESLVNEQKELFKTMDELNSLINWQQKWHQFISMVDTHTGNNINLLEDVNQLHNYLFNLQDINNDDIQDDLQQYKILEETLSTFVTFEDYHKQQKYDFDFTSYSLYHEQYKLWLELLNECDKKINGKWKICTDIYNDIQNKLSKNRQQQQHVTKLDGFLRKLNDMNVRVNSLRLSGQNITVEHQELKDINDEFTMITEESNLGTIFKQQQQYSDDQSIQQRYLELNQLKDTINHTIMEKQNKAKEQENTVQLMEDIKKLENITDSVDGLIDAVAPHHARMENGAFNKSDLQELLKKFIKEFKHHAQSIDKIYKNIEVKLKTKDETIKLAIDLLTSWKHHWKNSKAAAGIREHELQACIEQLQHDFFTKLALVNKNKKIEKQFLQQYPVHSSSSTTTTLYSYENQHQNELDIQLKRIIKDQASKLKVRIVPGHVGKYWFGNSNKRLVYCRILQSNMVMVRVGGGWVELSKFLLEHGCKEGVMLSDKEVNKNSKFTETYITVERSVSPSGRITIRGGGINSNDDGNIFNHTPSGTSSKTSISTRCKSPTAGYMDGDRFIRIDESGNQLAIKMIRADDDSFVPYHPNNKTLYQW